jgi:nitroreductase
MNEIHKLELVVDPMSVEEVINKRRSVRKFKTDPITDEQIDKLLKAAQMAPSAGNQQPLEVIVVTEDKDRLIEATGRQQFIVDAPVVFIILSKNIDTVNRYRDRGATLYHMQDTAASVQNVLLLAKSMGLDTCWIGAFDECMIKSLFNIPGGVRPLAIIPIGYGDMEPEGPGRKDIKEIVFKNNYGNKYYLD